MVIIICCKVAYNSNWFIRRSLRPIADKRRWILYRRSLWISTIVMMMVLTWCVLLVERAWNYYIYLLVGRMHPYLLICGRMHSVMTCKSMGMQTCRCGCVARGLFAGFVSLLMLWWLMFRYCQMLVSCRRAAAGKCFIWFWMEIIYH